MPAHNLVFGKVVSFPSGRSGENPFLARAELSPQKRMEFNALFQKIRKNTNKAEDPFTSGKEPAASIASYLEKGDSVDDAVFNLTAALTPYPAREDWMNDCILHKECGWPVYRLDEHTTGSQIPTMMINADSLLNGKSTEIDGIPAVHVRSLRSFHRLFAAAIRLMGVEAYQSALIYPENSGEREIGRGAVTLVTKDDILVASLDAHARVKGFVGVSIMDGICDISCQYAEHADDTALYLEKELELAFRKVIADMEDAGIISEDTITKLQRALEGFRLVYLMHNLEMLYNIWNRETVAEFNRRMEKELDAIKETRKELHQIIALSIKNAIEKDRENPLLPQIIAETFSHIPPNDYRDYAIVKMEIAKQTGEIPEIKSLEMIMKIENSVTEIETSATEIENEINSLVSEMNNRGIKKTHTRLFRSPEIINPGGLEESEIEKRTKEIVDRIASAYEQIISECDKNAMLMAEIDRINAFFAGFIKNSSLSEIKKNNIRNYAEAKYASLMVQY